jgi:hypothetical protein
MGQLDSSTESEREWAGHTTKWHCFFIIWKNSLHCLNLVCLGQTEQKWIVPSVVKTILTDFKESWLRKESYRGGVGGERWKGSSQASNSPAGLWGWSLAQRLSTQLTSLWIQARHIPHLSSQPKHAQGPTSVWSGRCDSSHARPRCAMD